MTAFCLCTHVARPASSSEPYGQIAARNLFGLHDPIPVQTPHVEPALPKVFLNGVATLGGKLAFLKVQYPPKPGQQQGEQSLILSEGQREGGIEMLEINEKAGTIRVNNSGTEMTIGFDKDAAKTAGTSTKAAPANAPNIAGGGRGMNPQSPGFQRMIPTRTGQQAPAIAPPPLPPSTQTRTPAGAQTAPAQKPLTQEEQALLNELERATQGSTAAPR